MMYADDDTPMSFAALDRLSRNRRALAEHDKAQENVCPECNGSGMVAIGPWGSRPARKICPVCNGTKGSARV